MTSSAPDPETIDIAKDSDAPETDVEPDTQSDPALAAGEEKSDWSSEGGGAVEGAATDTE